MGIFDELDCDTQFKFIKTLRSFPCLWDEKSEAFKAPKKKEYKTQRDLAFATLLFVLQENDRYKEATTDTVKHLYSSLFSSFKTQRNKIIFDRNYQTKVWYPLLADFLSSQSDQSQSLTPTEILLDEEDDNHVNQFLQVKLEECPPDSSEVDSGFPINLIQNRPDFGSRSSSPPPSSTNNIVRVPDTSTDSVASSLESKRRKLDSSSSTSIDKDFGNYVMIALSKMHEDQRVKAEGKITEILRQGQNGRL